VVNWFNMFPIPLLWGCPEQGTRPSSPLYLIKFSCISISTSSHTEGKCCRCVVQHQPGTVRAKVFLVCLNLSVECVMELRSRAGSICFPP
jgi:hypothetical protein